MTRRTVPLVSSRARALAHALAREAQRFRSWSFGYAAGVAIRKTFDAIVLAAMIAVPVALVLGAI
jgi:hypothetical protein